MMYYLPNQILKSIDGEDLTMDLVSFTVDQLQLIVARTTKWITEMDGECPGAKLMLDKLEPLVRTISEGEQGVATTPRLIRLVIRSSDYSKLSQEKMFIAHDVDEKLGPHLKRSQGYIDLDKDQYALLKELCESNPYMKKYAAIPFLKLVRNATTTTPAES